MDENGSERNGHLSWYMLSYAPNKRILNARLQAYQHFLIIKKSGFVQKNKALVFDST